MANRIEQAIEDALVDLCRGGETGFFEPQRNDPRTQKVADWMILNRPEFVPASEEKSFIPLVYRVKAKLARQAGARYWARIMRIIESNERMAAGIWPAP